MLTTLLFDFNNVILFQCKATLEAASNQIEEIEIPNAYSPLFYLNTELLDFIMQKRKTYKTVILSASEFTLDQPIVVEKIQPFFDEIFMAKNYGWAKDIPATYIETAKKLSNNPSEILFTDDKLSNIEAAKQAGLTTVQYQNNHSFITKVEEIIESQK